MEASLVVSLLFIITALSPLVIANTAIPNPDYLDACKNLQAGWSSETIYQTSPLSPISLCEGGSNEVLILDREVHKILEIELDTSVSTFHSTGNLSLDAIAFQPNADRIIAIGGSAFYVSDAESFHVIEEHPPPIAFSTLVVDPTDDSLYTGHWGNDTAIYHFDSEGKLLSTVHSGIQGCAQLALDSTNNLLYFSETFAGRISMLNLTSNTTTTLASGVAIPGTGEGISVAVNTIGDLYYYVAEGSGRGLWKYNGTAFEHIMDGMLGIGPILWSQKFDAVLCVPGYGACVVKYDPNASEPEKLTPTVNTGSIVETSDGLLLVGLEKTIYKIESGFIHEFLADLPFSCLKMELDGEDNIYAALSNDSVLIMKISRDGANSTWFAGQVEGALATFSYDSKNDAMVLLTGSGSPTKFDIWRVPMSNPSAYSKVLTIENVTNGACTVDDSGNIYLLERSANVLYKIPDGGSVAQQLYSSVVEHAYLVAVNIEYSSVLDSVILCRNDDLQAWPVSGGSSYLLAENNIGIDNDGIFENANNDLVCTHSGQIYRLSYHGGSLSVIFYVGVLVLGAAAVIICVVSVKRRH